MKRIATLVLFLALTVSSLAAGSDELYLDIYNEILQADSLQLNGHSEAAAARYLQAQTDLLKLKADHPTWNPDIVKFRLDYLAERLQTLAKFLPSPNAPAPGTTGPAKPAPSPGISSEQPTIAALRQQNANFQEQIRSLSLANVELQKKLKEALSVQPAPVSPEELARAQAKIVTLQKERDLLEVALDQEKAGVAGAIAAAKAAATDQARAELKARTEAEAKNSQMELDLAREATTAAETKLAVANKELDELKAARAQEVAQAAAAKAQAEAEAKQSQEEMKRLKEASTETDKILAAAGKELELLRSAHPPQIQGQTPEPAKQISEEGDRLKELMAQVSKDDAEIAVLKDHVAEREQKLVAANSELEALKVKQSTQPQAPPSEETKALTEERDKLKDELAQRSKDLADAESKHIQELLDLRTTLEQAQKERDELAKKLAAAPSAPAPTATTPAPAENSAMAQRLEQLEARIAVLEAAPVPYNGEELALLKKPPPPTNVEPSKAASPAAVHVRSVKDLPPGTKPLWEEALRASRAGDYTTAEQKYNAVLQQDPTNVYVLAFLANVQFAAGQLGDCEKTVQRALAADPDDPGSLYLLGLLRYRQDRLDEALDALSLSAKFNPTNAATQNFLGCVLADKGLRPAAETAMRKALQVDPDYADAHFNLAVVYAGNQPPSKELARWHYKRGVALGHAKSPTPEKLLGENNDQSSATLPASQ
jgi:Tfp pilus assembly protein PilF